MIVFHAGMLAGRVFVWAEKSEEDGAPKRRRVAGKKSAAGHTERYEYGADEKVLASLPTLAALDFSFEKKRFQDVSIALPAIAGKPIPSSPFIAELPSAKSKPKLCLRALTAYPLEWGEVVDILCACSHTKVLKPGVVIGDDLAFWSEALRFAGSLTARRHYLPSADDRGGEFRAVWTPVYIGADADIFTQIADRIPPVARALTEASALEPPSTPAAEILRTFLGGTLDHLVRSSTWGVKQRGTPSRKTDFAGVHDAWLSALRSPDNLITGEKDELGRFVEQVHEWARPLAVTVSSPFRLCFRLEEPEIAEAPRGRAKPASESWYVRYLLQPRDDLSLLIPLESAWKQNAANARILKGTGPEITEYLLTSLGQASGVCKGVAESLKTPRPEGYALDTQGAHRFLTERALALQQSGFGVLLPAWWTGKGSKFRLSVGASVKSPKMQSRSGLSMNEIVQFDWQAAIGGEKITFEELKALAALKVSLVRIRGQWVEINKEQIQAALDIQSKRTSREASVKDVVRMALGVTEAPHGLRVEKVKATGWVGSLLKSLENTEGLSSVSPSKSFKGELRPYQARGLSWLAFLSQWGMGACLADDMGLGKTVQTLALFQHYRDTHDKKPVLLVCPTTVVNNWQKESARFSPELPLLIHHGATRSKGTEFKKDAQAAGLVISSYGLLYRDVKLFQEVEWSGIVLDEAQNIKNSETKQAKAARALKANYRIALTGTPVENNVGDLWSIMEFLNPGFLGNHAQFKRKFFVPIQAEKDPEAMDRLKRITGPFILRRLKTDKSVIADLPDKMEMKVFCPLTKEQASLYAAVVKETEENLSGCDGMKRKGLILSTLSKLKQVCNHPAHFLADNSSIAGRSGKLARLTEMLEETLGVGDRALIFTQFTEMGKLLQKHLQESFGAEVLFLHGSLTKPNRDRLVERFQQPNGPSIFVLSLKAGGSGLNLTAANHVFHFDRWWNPAVENQATDRVFRIGQTKNVQVHKFVCAGTLEDKIDEIIEMKRDVAEKVLGAGEGWLTELSNTDLKKLWTLRKEALGE